MKLGSKTILWIELSVLVVGLATVFFFRAEATWLYVFVLLTVLVLADHFRKKAEYLELSTKQTAGIVNGFLDGVYVFSELEDRGYVLNVGAKAYWSKGDLNISVNDSGTIGNYLKPQFDTEELGQGVLLILNSKLALYFRHGYGVGLVFSKQ